MAIRRPVIPATGRVARSGADGRDEAVRLGGGRRRLGRLGRLVVERRGVRLAGHPGERRYAS